MKDIDQSIAKMLREIRESRKISQETLSFDSNLHRTYISQLERGLKSVTVKTLLKITTALDIEIDDFIKLVNDDRKTL
ncbi:MAG: helix-turn-helix transcriptional regulator [Paramuribaculum sp.]|nr:helix-turn-helix transcriptional regulator [Paramuribaculum sp.]